MSANRSSAKHIVGRVTADGPSSSQVLQFYSLLSEVPLIHQPLTLVCLSVCVSFKRALLLIMDLGKVYDKC